MAKAAKINEIDEFESFDILGHPALFTSERVDRSSVPDGYYAYDIRGTDDDGGGTPATIESRVMVNFHGTVITRQPLEIPAEGYISLADKDWGYVDSFSEFGNKFAYNPRSNMWTYVAA